MSQPPNSHWTPTTFLRFEESFDTSLGTVRIITDAGPAYIKALGNREGPHPLACEWVATQLVHWFGLPTFEIALLEVDAEVDEIPFPTGGQASSGTAFVSQAMAGHVWGGSEQELAGLVNKEDVSRLVVFDTWTLNCDRHPPDLKLRKPNRDNVFLADLVNHGKGATKLIAMDHTCCFTCHKEINASADQIARIKDERLFGLFPEFIPFVREEVVEQCVAKLSSLKKDLIEKIVETIPKDWEVGSVGRKALTRLIWARAEYITEHIPTEIAKRCWPGKLFDIGPEGKV